MGDSVVQWFEIDSIHAGSPGSILDAGWGKKC